MGETALVRFDVSAAAIAELSKQYMAIKVKDENDKAGAEVAHKARINVRNTRLAVEKRRVEGKADAMATCRAYDAEGNRLRRLLEPIEAYLDTQEKIVTEAKERARLAAEEAERQRIAAEEQARKDSEAKALADERANLAEERAALEAERQKQAAEVRKALDEQRVERQRIEAIEAKQKADRDEIEAARRAVEYKAALEKAQAEAAELARVETEHRIAREAADKARHEAAEEAEKKRVAAMLPDVQKIHEFGKQLSQVETPPVKSAEAKAFLSSINDTIEDMVTRCKEFRAKGK